MTGIRNMDRWMLMSLVVLLAIGITMVLNTSYLFSQERFGDGTYLFRKQLAATGLGLAGLAIALLLPPAAYRRLAGPSLIVALIALVLVLVPDIGVVRGGAHRWLGTPPFVFQPSELAKVSFVLYLAYTLSRRPTGWTVSCPGFCPRCWSPACSWPSWWPSRISAPRSFSPSSPWPCCSSPGAV